MWHQLIKPMDMPVLPACTHAHWATRQLASHGTHALQLPSPGAKTGWRLAWQTMIRELAPQDSKGAYQRPGYSFGGVIGSPEFPVSSNPVTCGQRFA